MAQERTTKSPGFVIQSWQRLNDPQDGRAALLVSLGLLALEGVLCSLIILKVPYTEIDWEAYMSQVTGFVQGERDYKELKGGTGPIVYPAGHLYIFTALQQFTNGNVPSAQIWFMGLYLVNLAFVLLVYAQSKAVPPWVLVLLCLSKRVHSIFLLRLFNDCWAMAFFYGTVAVLQRRQWLLGLLLFSAAVSVKMNILLMAPALLLLLLKDVSFMRVAMALGVAAALQLFLGLPFLLTYPWSYIARSFELSRVFIHHWSVNLKFLPEHIFLSKPLALALLALHLSLLFIFANCKWCRSSGGILQTIKTQQRAGRKRRHVTAAHVTTTMFVANFIGIVCARTLHYQFYSWYFHMLPYLLWLCPFPVVVRLLLWAGIEYCWNVFPSTPVSSGLLLALHLTVLLGLWLARDESPYGAPQKSKALKD